MTLMEMDVNSPTLLMTCYGAVGDAENARRAAQIALARAERILAQDQNNGTAMGYAVCALAFLGEAERAREWINRALLIDPDNMNMRYNFACSMTVLKQTEAALELLGPVLETSHIDRLNHAKVDPDLDPLREDAGTLGRWDDGILGSCGSLGLTYRGTDFCTRWRNASTTYTGPSFLTPMSCASRNCPS
jgi:tetratricopeptide (TPR) repeat protein